MDDKEEAAYKKIEQMYNNPKSHGFILHLIHAFLPGANKASKIFSDGKTKVYKCCILGEEVMSVDDAMSIVHNLDMKTVLQGMFNPEAQEKVRENILASKRDREMGIAGTNTDKCLSQSAFAALQSFMMNEILRGNRELNGLTRSMMRSGE